MDLIFVLTGKEYAGQTGLILKNGLASTIVEKKENSLIHFKRTGHSPNDILVQPLEKLTYQEDLKS